MNKYKKLLSNSVIFAIGNFGSKLINIVMVPLYTVYMSTSSYGTVDLVTTVVSLLLPFFSLCVYEGILRFVMEKNSDKASVFTNSFVIQCGLTIFIAILIPIISISSIGEFSTWVIVILLLQLFQVLFSQFVRGLEKVISYAMNGILMTLVMASSNILLIAILKMGIEGYLFSIILSNLVSIVFLVIKEKIWQYWDKNKLHKQMMKKILLFSIPIVPNTLMWWLINGSSRFFIVHFSGTDANGLFAVANKVPIMLTTLTTIFNQAWQMSAIEEYDSKERKSFYNDIFTQYSSLLFIGTGAIITILIPLFKVVIGKDFFSSWIYVPFLLIGVIYSSFATFLGTNYVAAKETKGLIITSIYCGIVNLALNLLLIPYFGAMGASISSMASFLVLWLARIRDTKKYVEIDIDIKNILLSHFIIVIQITCLFYFSDSNFLFLILGGLFLILLFVNRNILLMIKKLVVNK